MPFELNTPVATVLLLGGLVVLWKCAELLVAGAVGLAERLGISQLIVGLTVVAMGTSAPEAASSIAAVLEEAGGDLALGNVYGSNVANLALVGGLVAILRPLHVRKRTLRRDIPAMIVVEMLLWPILMAGLLSRPKAGLLLAVFAGLIMATVWIARRERAKDRAAAENGNIAAHGSQRLGACVLLALAGLIGLSAGAKMTVAGAVYLGAKIGLSEAVIGLTIIAFGTSLPELVTCVVAAVKGQHDISVGNLVGSNIFNALLVVGAAGMVRPFPATARFAGGADFWIMIGVSVGFAGLIVIGRRVIGRLGGVLLVCTYAAYVVYLVIQR